jgi:phosphatidylglycerol:prolipoprotein diacylglycerol transferase
VIIGVIGKGFGYVLFYGEASSPTIRWRSCESGMRHVVSRRVFACVAVIASARRYGGAARGRCQYPVPNGHTAFFLVRIANFINAELWGRPTDLPWV